MLGSADKTAILARADRLSTRARGWMVWERYAPVFALAALILALFLIGSFAGLWERIGDPWRLIALIAALYFIAAAAWRARDVKMPSRNAAARRVERDSGLKHRPIETLRDGPALSETLWDEHQRIALRASQDLRPRDCRANPRAYG